MWLSCGCHVAASSPVLLHLTCVCVVQDCEANQQWLVHRHEDLAAALFRLLSVDGACAAAIAADVAADYG